MKKVIVLGNTLYNTLGLIRSVGEKGLPVILILEPGRKADCFVRFSKYLSRVHYSTSLEDGLAILKREYGNESEKPIVLCGSDPTIKLLDAHYDELKDKFHVFNAGKQGRIGYFLDKINAFPLAEANGLTLIRTWQLKSGDSLPSDLVYPCLIKGNNSTTSTKGDMFICRDENELKTSLHEGVDYLVQEYVEKEYELDIVGFSAKHGEDVFIPAAVRKLRDEIHRQSVYIRLDAISDYPELPIEGIKNFIKDIGYEGVFSVELIYSHGKYYFLEVNLRNDGCGYLYTAAGANYPYLWVKYGMGKLSQADFDEMKVKTPYLLMHEDDAYNMLEGKVPVLQWIKECLGADAHFILNARDPMPFVVSTLIHARQLCKKILRKIGVKI